MLCGSSGIRFKLNRALRSASPVFPTRILNAQCRREPSLHFGQAKPAAALEPGLSPEFCDILTVAHSDQQRDTTLLN